MVEERCWNGIEVGEDVWMLRDHLLFFRPLVPAAIRHVRIRIFKKQVLFVLLVDGRPRQRRQNNELGIGMIAPKRVREKAHCRAQIIFGFFRETNNQ